MKTIRELAALHGLSRSTLLYYDKLGLLGATTRTSTNYRLYNQDCKNRLARICEFRSAGLSLECIKTLLDEEETKIGLALEARLKSINAEIQELRKQQQQILRLLGNTDQLKDTRIMTKASWVDLLRKSGFTEKDMQLWHHTFETHSPEAHQDFLESIGIDENEIQLIRDASRTSPPTTRQL